MFKTYPRVIIAFYVQSCILRFSTILISPEHRSQNDALTQTYPLQTQR